MNSGIQYQQVCDSIINTNFDYATVQLQNDYKIIVSNFGLRIFGPFKSDNKSEFLWIDPVISDPISFSKFCNDGNWNVGGDRLWISPEIQYNCRDRKDFWKTLFISKDIEPGKFKLSADGNTVKWNGTISLDAFNIAVGKQNFILDAKVEKCNIPELYNKENVACIGYRISGSISTVGRSTALTSLWNLAQILPSGKLYIRVNKNPEIVDYFENAQDVNVINDINCSIIPITGDRMYKLGYKSNDVTGIMAYLHEEEKNNWLMIKKFNNSPNGNYADEPPGKPGENNCSVYMYNNDGITGKFAEMECFSPACGANAGIATSKLEVDTWYLKGNLKDLSDILKNTML